MNSKRFTLQDLILIACLSAIGLAIKPVINPMIHLVSSVIRIPGGSLSGGFLMMWMALARVIVNKPGSALLFGITQGITVMLLGSFGSHGVFSVVSYSLPGLMVEVVAMLFRLFKYQLSIINCYLPLSLYCIIANITGTLIVATVIMQVPPLLLAISLTTATISGMLGGVLADIVLKKLVKYQIVNSVLVNSE